MVPKLIIPGPRVTLRSIESTDLPVLWNHIYGEKDPEWKRWDAPYFPIEHLAYEQYCNQMYEKVIRVERPRRMLVDVAGTGVGTVSYYWEHEASNWLEAGIDIYDSNYWSNGYGTEALTLWIDHLFQTLPLVRVGMTTWSGNPRMVRCAEKLGFQLEGRLRKCRLYEGEYYDSIRMGVLREEWMRHPCAGAF